MIDDILSAYDPTVLECSMLSLAFAEWLAIGCKLCSLFL